MGRNEKVMAENEIDILVSEVEALCQESKGPFPHKDCRKLRDGKVDYGSVVPDMDWCMKTIAGYCSWGDKLKKWPKSKIAEAQENLARTFFEKHPEYKPLELKITEMETPDLYADLLLHEKMRAALLRLFFLLWNEAS